MVHDMVVHDNELYVSGTFHHAGNVSARAVAKWDGSRWCGFGTDVDLPRYLAVRLNFYNDTLYLSGGWDTVNGMHVNGLVKWIGGSYIDTCSASFTSTGDFDDLSNQYSIYPNLVEGSIKIEKLYSSQNLISCKIVDISGKVLKEEYISLLTGRKEVDVSELAAGIYILTIQSTEFNRSYKFIRQ
jgi:hypothetical protein